MSNSFFSGRIPEKLKIHVIEYAKILGKSNTELLIEALANHTSFQLDTSEDENQPVQLPNLLKHLQDEIQNLKQLINLHDNEIKQLKSELVINNMPSQLDLNINTVNSDNFNRSLFSDDNADNSIDNKLEKTDFKFNDWEPMPEQTMSLLTGINRNHLTRHRTKIAKGTIDPNETLEGTIKGIPCSLKFYGESGRGEKRKSQLWQATPINTVDLIL